MNEDCVFMYLDDVLAVSDNETADKTDLERMFEVIKLNVHNLELLVYHANSERLFTNKINAINEDNMNRTCEYRRSFGENEDKLTDTLKIKKRQLAFLRHIMREKSLENLILTGQNEGKRAKENNA